MIGMVWANDLDGAIGTGSTLPWHVPADFQHFRRLTLGCPIVMGRRTFESIGAKPLPKRRNIVLSSRGDLNVAGIETAASLVEAITLADVGEDPVWLIGGGEVYRAGMDIADVLVVSTIRLHSGATVLAPTISPQQWQHVRDRNQLRHDVTGVSDPQDSWREVSGDAAWRVDVWQRLSGFYQPQGL